MGEIKVTDSVTFDIWPEDLTLGAMVVAIEQATEKGFTGDSQMVIRHVGDGGVAVTFSRQ